MTTATATKFEVGTTYSTRSACDHNCIFAWTVVSRTAKFMVVKDKFGKTTRCGIKSHNGEIEYAYPAGKFSMAPQISSEDTKTLLCDWEK